MLKTGFFILTLIAIVGCNQKTSKPSKGSVFDRYGKRSEPKDDSSVVLSEEEKVIVEEKVFVSPCENGKYSVTPESLTIFKGSLKKSIGNQKTNPMISNATSDDIQQGKLAMDMFKKDQDIQTATLDYFIDQEGQDDEVNEVLDITVSGDDKTKVNEHRTDLLKDDFTLSLTVLGDQLNEPFDKRINLSEIDFKLFDLDGVSEDLKQQTEYVLPALKQTRIAKLNFGNENIDLNFSVKEECFLSLDQAKELERRFIQGMEQRKAEKREEELAIANKAKILTDNITSLEVLIDQINAQRLQEFQKIEAERDELTIQVSKELQAEVAQLRPEVDVDTEENQATPKKKLTKEEQQRKRNETRRRTRSRTRKISERRQIELYTPDSLAFKVDMAKIILGRMARMDMSDLETEHFEKMRLNKEYLAEKAAKQKDKAQELVTQEQESLDKERESELDAALQAQFEMQVTTRVDELIKFKQEASHNAHQQQLDKAYQDLEQARLAKNEFEANMSEESEDELEFISSLKAKIEQEVLGYQLTRVNDSEIDQ